MAHDEHEMSVRDENGPPAKRSLTLEDPQGMEHGMDEPADNSEEEQRWDQQDIPEEVRDIQFLVFWLNRRTKIHDRHRGLLMQVIFLVFFTMALMQHYYAGGFYLVSGVGGVVAGGEWDQGASTGLFFEKTFSDVQEVGDWYAWAVSSESMLALYGNDNDTYQGQNRILPEIVRFSQRRVKNIPSRCGATSKHVDNRFKDFFDGCWSGYGFSDENTKGFVEGIDDMNMTCNATEVERDYWPCGCDDLDRSGFTHRVQNIEGFKVSVPEAMHTIPNWAGRFAEYSTHSYYFDTYADRSQATYLQKIACLEGQNWIDKSTRQVEIVWFTYNPPTDLFLRHRLSAEFTKEGFIYAKAELITFKWMTFEATLSQIADIITFVFIVGYTFQLLYSVGHYIYTTRRVVMWAFSVWRIFDIVNFALFLYVYVWKFIFMSIGDVTMILPEDETGVPSNLRNSAYWTAQLKESHYNSEIFTLLLGYSSHYEFIVKLTAFNALLSWIRLFKFVGLSPRLNLLSETIKEAAGDLFALFLYIMLITHAFALCGMLLFSSQMIEFSTYSYSFTSLLRWLVGDFDYDAFLEVTLWTHTAFTLFLFWGYLIMVWLLLLNMVISIISDGFAAAKRRQDLALGSAPVGTQLRYLGRVLEEFVKFYICKRKPRVKVDPEGPIKRGIFSLSIDGVSLENITKAVTELRNQSLRTAEGVRYWPEEHALSKMGCVFPSVHQTVLADQLLDVCGKDKSKAEYLAKALCWYLDVRYNGIRGSVYFSRVFYEEVWKEAVIQTSDGYRKEYLDALMSDDGERDATREANPFTELRGEVHDMILDLETRIVNEIRKSNGQQEIIPGYPPPPPTSPFSYSAHSLRHPPYGKHDSSNSLWSQVRYAPYGYDAHTYSRSRHALQHMDMQFE